MLGVSTSLMERYLSAAWKVAGVAVASPKITPSLETFRVRGDLSQHDHVEGLPIGTRGGISITHYFPVDAEYVISPRLYRETVNIIRGLELPHELEVAIDGQRVRLAAFGGPKDEQANYLQPTLAGDEMEKRFQVRMPITAGLHTVTVAFIKKSSATTLELLQPFGRERIDPITPVGIPELERVTLEGPFKPAARSASSPSRRRIFVCEPAAGQDAACATKILTTVARRAYRGPLDEAETRRLLGFYDEERKKGGSFTDGIEAALRFVLVNPRFLFRVEQDPANVAPGTVYRIPRSRAGVAAVVLHLEQHPGRRVADGGRARPAQEPAGARAAGAADAEGPTRRRAGRQLRRPMAVPAQRAGPLARPRRLPGLRPQPARGVPARDRDAVREHRPRGPDRA